MLKVIVIESDPAVAWLLREELEEAGFGVKVCPSYSHALAALDSWAVDVVVGDIDELHERDAHSLAAIKQTGKCSVVLLGPRDIAPLGDNEPLMLRKSSDLQPLIACLRTRAARSLWMRSYPANC